MFYQRRATYEMLTMDEPSSSGTTQQQQVSGDSPRRKHSRHAEARRHPKRRDSQTRDDSPSHMGAIYQPQDEGPTGTPPGETSSRRVLIDPNTTVYDDDENDEDNTYANTAGLETEYGEELDELEQYELDDRLGEMMPIAFGRRNRREGLFGSSMARSIQPGSSWDAAEFLPSAINDLSSENQTKCSEEEIEEEKGIRKYAKLILPHVGLVFITCAYTLIGATIFYMTENPNEIANKRRQLDRIYSRQEEFVSALLRLAASNGTAPRESWAMLARTHMNDMSDQLFVSFEKFFLTSKEVKLNTINPIWTFSTALFFSVTVVTTIGYGNPVPITQFGRMMCISFSLFGIPLTLVTIADLGKFLSEHLIWIYGKYLKLKHMLCRRMDARQHIKERRERVCDECEHQRGIGENMQIVDEQREGGQTVLSCSKVIYSKREGRRGRVLNFCWLIPLGHIELIVPLANAYAAPFWGKWKKIPALLVFGILVLYTALGGVLMSHLEPWSFFTSFYWSFITMTTVGFGDLMPRRDEYMYFILLYIVLGLAITTMCIDLVGVQYIRKIHYFGRKIQDARSALAVVGGKVVLVSELYANLMQKRARSSARDAFIIENLYVSKHIIPFIPSDIRFIRYIDQATQQDQTSLTNSTSSLELNSCRFCHSRFSISNHV